MASTSAAVKQEPLSHAERGALGGAATRKAHKISKLSGQSKHSFSKRYEMLSGLSVPAIETLGELIRPEHPAPVRLAAAKEILDRVDGKPRQAATLEVKTDLTTMHLDALRALAAQAPDLIDVTPADHG